LKPANSGQCRPTNNAAEIGFAKTLRKIGGQKILPSAFNFTLEKEKKI